MTTKPDQSQRIRELERKLEDLSALVRAIKPTRNIGSIDQIIRPAKTCAPSTGSYPTTGNTVPIKFLDASNTGLPSAVTLTERSASQQAVAATVQGGIPVVGTVVFVVRYEQQWIVVNSQNSILFKAPSGGIPARVSTIEGSATCEIVKHPSAGVLALSGISVTIYNWSESIICADGDRYGAAIWIDGQWEAIAEDCTPQGATLSAFGYIAPLTTVPGEYTFNAVSGFGQIGAFETNLEDFLSSVEGDLAVTEANDTLSSNATVDIV